MPRKKKIKERFVTAGIADNLIRIAWKQKTTVNELRALNPGIKCNSFILVLGQKVRIS